MWKSIPQKDAVCVWMRANWNRWNNFRGRADYNPQWQMMKDSRDGCIKGPCCRHNG